MNDKDNNVNNSAQVNNVPSASSTVTQTANQATQTTPSNSVNQTNNVAQSSNVAPAPAPSAQVVTPNQTTINPSESVINTKKTTSSNKVFFLVIIVVGLFVFFLDDIVDYFTEDNFQYIYGDSTNYESGNLVDGYIKIGEKNSFIKVKKVRFYNFQKSTDTSLVLNYESSSNITDSTSLEVYILLFDSNKDLIYKKLFNTGDKIEKDSIRQYTLSVTNDIYQAAFYAKTVVFTNNEKKQLTNMKCKYAISNENVDLTYQVVYSFKNNDLISYEVTKEYKSLKEKADVTKYKDELKLEYLRVNDAKIANKYEDNYLNYKVDLSNVPQGFSVLYEGGTLPKNIKNAENLKDWTCE